MLLVGSVLLVLGVALAASQEACLLDKPRTDCGYFGIDQKGCEADGCCWNPKDNEPWCFRKSSVSSNVCQPDKSPRKDCGFVGVDQQGCEGMGCCWSPKENEPWCFTASDLGTAPQCDPNSPRRDCGHFGITQQDCQKQGCCWSPANDQPYCFTKTSPPPPTPTCLPDEYRFDCGAVGTTQEQCEQQGCCWSPADGQPWCFQKTGGLNPSQCKAQSPRYDCGDVGTNEADCQRVGCCWDPKDNEPWCFYQSPIYSVQSSTPTAAGVKLTIATGGTSLSLPFGSNISPLTVEITQETNDRLHVKIYDPNNQRWEVPTSALPVPDAPSSPPASPKYSYQVAGVGKEFFFVVSRKSNSETLFNTSAYGALQFGDRYLSIGTSLPVGYNIYGLGERKSHLRLTTRNSGDNCGNYYPMFNSDIPTIPENFNLYGSHPFYLDVRNGGLSHGVFLRNSDPMDVILSNDALQYKVIGGVLDFYFFLGPEPEAVIQQYTEVIGRPFLPPYWSLGFHQCRYGYENLQQLIDVVDGYNSSKIPLDTIWSDIDHMDNYKDFTLNPYNFPTNQVKAFVSKLHNNGLRYVVIVDPGINIDPGYIPYDRGLQQDIFLKDNNGNNFVGLVWPGRVYYPDFFNPKTDAYWTQEIKDFLNLVNVDGLWLDMNECANFCDGQCASATLAEEMAAFRKGETVRMMASNFDPNNPTYLINNRCFKVPLYTRTLAMDAQYYGDVLELDAHNLYGFMESISTYKSLANLRPNVRPFVLSRATFPGCGSYAAHWNGDNTAHDTDLYYSIPMMLSFQLFGMPFVGSDICGFFGDTTEELCARWMELGAFYPFARNHNFKGPIGQEPYRWPSVAAISRKVLAIRYSLLPYYYTLFYKAHRSVDSSNPPAATVVRPLFFEFPTDANTYPIDWQFMLGSALLISPVLRVGDAGKQVSAYFPPAKWYDWFTYEVTSANGGEAITINTPLDHIPIHIRGGSVLALQDPGLNTEESRANNFSLLVAPDSNGGAKGDIFLDDGISINVASYTFVDYLVSGNTLTAGVKGTGYASNLPPLDRVVILGVSSQPSSVSINSTATSDFSYNATSQALTVGPGLKIPMSQQYTLSWK